jgi:hypothetical protein
LSETIILSKDDGYDKKQNGKSLLARDPHTCGSNGVRASGLSQANPASLCGKHRDGIMRKAARNRPLRASEKRFNRLISKRRFRVEKCFGTMKRLFGLYRVCYFGVDKTHAQLALAAIAQNLLKAANKITLSPQIPAIAYFQGRFIL